MFLGLLTIGDQATQKINQEDDIFAKQELINQWHQPVFHVGTNAGDELDVESPK